MRILVNAASANMGGSVTYLTNVLPELARLCAERRNGHSFVLIAPDRTLALLADVLGRPEFSSVAYSSPPAQTLRRIAYDQLQVPRLAWKHRADVLYSSNGFGTFCAPCPEVLLIRNALYFCPLVAQKYRELGRSLRALGLRRVWSLVSIRAADRVLFPTRAMLELVAAFLRLGDEKAAVVHYGFDRDTFFAADAAEPELARHMAAWRKQGATVLLGVSAYAVHKNFETLIEALPAVLEHGKPVKLVLTLAREVTTDVHEYDALIERIDELGLGEVVQLAGHAPYRQLHHLYANADVFVSPTFAESFGHSMVEAMACGLPVVAADVAVSREILGGSALYFSPFDARQCAERIVALVADPVLRARLRDEALRRAGAFSWRSHAEALLDEFERCGRGGLRRPVARVEQERVR